MKKTLVIFFLFIKLIGVNAKNDSTCSKTTSYKNFIAPVTLLGLGVYSRFDTPFGSIEMREFRNKQHPNFHNDTDDYLQFAPIVFGYGLGILPNMKSKSDFVNKSLLLLKSEIIMASIVYPLKEIVGDRRPDTGASNSWPSGHTTQAFVAATFLDHEYRHKSIWISVAAYSCASTVAIFRVLNDRHWSADVLAGAGIGILSTNIAYLTHQYKWKNFKFLNNKEITFLPYYQHNGGGLIISARL